MNAEGDLGVNPVLGYLIVLDAYLHILYVNGLDILHGLGSLIDDVLHGILKTFSGITQDFNDF